MSAWQAESQQSFICMCLLIFLGNITISGGMTFTVDSDLNGDSPQFTLICISIGGPATTVTWTSYSVPASGDEMTVFDGNTIAPQYTHTLTVTGGSGMGGDYTCTLANNKPSSASASYTVQGTGDTASTSATCVYTIITILPPVASTPTNLVAVQESLTSIRVSWRPPTPLGDTTGYRIYYSGGSSGNEDVSDYSIDKYLLTGLQNGEIYTISIMATSQHLPSESIAADMEVMLGEDMYKYR